MAKNHLIKLIVLAIGFIGFASPVCALTKQEFLDEVRRMKNINYQKIEASKTDLEELIAKTINESKSANLNDRKPLSAIQIGDSIRSLKNKRDELLLRQDFYDRLIFQVDQNYHTGSFKVFLEKSLKSMAIADVKTSESNLWQFLTYLAVVIDKVPPKTENLVGFIEGYMNFSSIKNPIEPGEYFSRMDYSDGVFIEQAQSVPRDQVGENLDLSGQENGTKTNARLRPRYLLDAPELKAVDQLIQSKSTVE